ncbi:MAG: hypothetical protein K9M36_00050 [Candidatus Pacebacteria bacterium]|nr:hypothetical protein [Candidatus Paceibacterota bacterium]
MIKNTSQGFVILFSVLIAAAILLVGFGIYSTSYKSTVLSSVARESHTAFYAADTGVECVLWAMTEFSGGNPPASINCVDNYTSMLPNSLSPQGDIIISFPMPDNRACSRVAVNPDYIDQNGTSMFKIHSRGYNICDFQGGQYVPMTSDPLLVERVLQVFLPDTSAQAQLNTIVGQSSNSGLQKTYSGTPANQAQLNQQMNAAPAPAGSGATSKVIAP